MSDDTAPNLVLSVEAELGALRLRVALQAGERPVAIVGPNGSGKSTLLRLLAGAPIAATGSITLDGRTLLDSNRDINLPPEARNVGYVPQSHGLFPHLTALDNVAFGLFDLPSTRRRARALAALTELGVAHVAARVPAALSGGERQRVALARALVLQPALLLLDEPLAAVDVAARRSLRVLLAQRLRALGRPALLVTHELRDLRAIDPEIVVLQAGRVVQRGDLGTLRDAPANAFVAELVDAEEDDRREEPR